MTFVTRGAPGRRELLLFEHPSAGIQLPAGTVELGETPDDAALREAIEETGLAGLGAPRWLASHDEPLAAGTCALLEQTPVYSRPDAGSFDWARLRRGIVVEVERQLGEFVQITFREHDRYPDPTYVNYQITGWVPEHLLAPMQRRCFYQIEHTAPTPDEWVGDGDVRNVRLFWAALERLPRIVSPQDTWIAVLREPTAFAG